MVMKDHRVERTIPWANQPAPRSSHPAPRLGPSLWSLAHLAMPRRETPMRRRL